MIAPTRGERNNNPGNIEYHPDIKWEGQDGIELIPKGRHFAPRFARFCTPLYGLRALARILLNYVNKDACLTLHDIITRWAPPGPGDDNDTASYIAQACRYCGLLEGEDFLPTDANMMALIRCIVDRENDNRCIYAPSLIAAAIYQARAAG